jgi:hypothetical protein
MCLASAVGRDAISAHIRHDDGTIDTDAHLGAVRATNPNSLLETERIFQPRDGGSHVWIDEHRRHGGRRRRTIAEHGETVLAAPCCTDGSDSRHPAWSMIVGWRCWT